MQVYKAPTHDMRFAIETFDFDRVAEIERYADFDLETVSALLEEAAKFCTNEMLPLNKVGDRVGLVFDPATGDVKLPDGFRALYKAYVKSGLGGIAQPAEHGGGGAPYAISIGLSELSTATCKSFSMCPGLNHGLIEALVHHGTDEQKENYLPHLVSGEWTGTMCLTEPQCGTDLGLIRTKAEPQADGSYKLTGTKIWITFGEHDLADNIIHLVLARLPDAPAGIKGISAFIVPKVLLDGTRNGIRCGGLEHKMGIHASPTCVMNMEDATGFLVGEAHKGMRSMFVMMNAARLHVGIEGIALGEIAYQAAVAFARDRRQGRSLDPAKRERDKPADNILVHPDVRRQLMNIRATTEGLRGLAAWLGNLIDISHNHADEAVRQEADDLVALLTPIMKAYGTDRGFANISDAMQVTGGAGYTQDWPIEQYLRDGRIAAIYEGTNHVQALDLVGRKLPRAGGRLYKAFAKRVHQLCKPHEDAGTHAEFVGPLRVAIDRLNAVTMELGMKGMQDGEEAAAAASNYLTAFGITLLGYIWAREAIAASEREGRFYRTKLKTARYYFSHVLPETESLYRIIAAGKANMMAFDDDEF
ncbi:MAG: acyl-CoA dehydrogenase C-terminal domain-containing protein [bacterium]|nr:acyl-CoA dehydrogenase C-terminal domain-containing protein [Myxococcales bacterium]